MTTQTSEIDNPSALSCFIPFRTDVPVVAMSSVITTCIPENVLPSIDFAVP